MKEKFQSCKDLQFLIWEDLTLVTGPVFSLQELNKDLKTTDFSLFNKVALKFVLEKSTDGGGRFHYYIL